MTLVKKHRLRTKKSLIDTLPELVISALANHEDFVVTYETDPNTKKKSLYVMSGELITPDMLATLKQQIERKKEEGNSIITRDWK
jgi:predicted dinucleotide-utilizing enzyme